MYLLSGLPQQSVIGQRDQWNETNGPRSFQTGKPRPIAFLSISPTASTVSSQDSAQSQVEHTAHARRHLLGAATSMFSVLRGAREH